MNRISIIGGGNMGGAIAKGLLKSNQIAAKDITISDISEKTLNNFRVISDEWKLTTSNEEAIADSEIIILAVKPWLVEKIAGEIREKTDYNNQIIVSIAAGVELKTLQSLFSENAILFRLIPNTAIEVMESVSTVTSINASKEQIEKICLIFEEMGKVFYVENEKLLNAFMALSSCGIAYAFRYIRAAMEGGVEMGIYPETAKEVIMQTLKGAVKLLEENHSHPETEIDKVTTPGGITIRGLNEMEANGFTNAVIKGLKKSLP
ncbi:MAG TPA: pyrroline-5-carboxylate reductase [Paludibacteraceae bacterium]|nr:pyrroline-5-carboxylate reductase [Paludibacteraceae bacterium]